MNLNPAYDFCSLPALVSPTDPATQRIIPNPRVRVTAGLPYSGKGTAYPIHQSGVVDTRADPTFATIHVRGVDRAPKR
jgi:hypothetical protein